VHFVGLFLSSLLKMHGPKNKIRMVFLLKRQMEDLDADGRKNI